MTAKIRQLAPDAHASQQVVPFKQAPDIGGQFAYTECGWLRLKLQKLHRPLPQRPPGRAGGIVAAEFRCRPIHLGLSGLLQSAADMAANILIGSDAAH